jgi:hypothetical protein
MTRTWHPLATPDERAVAEREAGGSGKPSERNLLDGREALVHDDFWVAWFVAPRCLAVVPAHRFRAPLSGGSAVSWVDACLPKLCERSGAGSGEVDLLFGTELGKADVTMGAIGLAKGFAAGATAASEKRPSRLRLPGQSPTVLTARPPAGLGERRQSASEECLGDVFGEWSELFSPDADGLRELVREWREKADGAAVGLVEVAGGEGALAKER